MTNGAADPLFGVRSKIERAKQHIVDLDGTLRAFYDSNPYRVSHKRDPQSRKLVYYVKSVEATPPRIALVAGDAIQNLRGSLDHLAYQLLLVGTAGRPTPRQIKKVAFPIYDSAAKYVAESPGKVEGMRQDAIDAINAAEPYHGGNGQQLWTIHALNNIDKHRLLIAVGSAFKSVNLGAYMQASMQKLHDSLPEDHPFQGTVFPVLDFYVRPADRLCPLKVGDELFIGSPDDEVNEKMQFTFDVVLSEPQIVQSEPLIETLHQLANVVDGIVTQFTAFL